MIVHLASRRCKLATIEKRHPGATVVVVTSKHDGNLVVVGHAQHQISSRQTPTEAADWQKTKARRTDPKFGSGFPKHNCRADF
jgi:hypothetical protein